MKVIGYEGFRRDGAPLSWGAAAVVVKDGALINAASGIGRTRTDEEINELVAVGAITRLPKPVTFKSFKSATFSPVVLEVDLEAMEALKIGTVVKADKVVDGEAARFLVFRERASFDSARDAIANEACRNALSGKLRPEEKGTLLTAALTISAHHDGLNAIWAHHMGEGQSVEQKERFARRARLRLRTDDHRRRFDTFLHGLEKCGEWYHLVYDDGVARRGGLDLEWLSRITGALLTAHQTFAALSTKSFPWLDRQSSNQIHRMEGAASAMFTFKANVEGASLGEQVARFLELEYLKGALQGTAAVPAEPALEEALRTIAKPDADTTARQLIGVIKDTGRDIQAVVLEAKEAGEPIQERAASADTAGILRRIEQEQYSSPLTLLGYLSGSVNEWQRIQLSIFPGLRLAVNPEKDQTGSRPRGIDDVFGRRESYVKPYLFTVTRELRKNGTTRFFLNEVAALASGAKVTAIPSGVVYGGLVATDLTLERSGHGHFLLRRGDTSYRVPADSVDLRTAQEWMLEYAEFCFSVELADVGTRRLAPPLMPTAGENIRTLWALAHIGRPASEQELDELALQHFGVNRGLSARRLVRTWGEHFAFDSKSSLLSATELGEQVFRAFRVMDRRAVRSALPATLSDENDVVEPRGDVLTTSG